jgi:hypothetical protein
MSEVASLVLATMALAMTQTPPPSREPPPCLRAIAAMDAGSTPDAAGFERVACPDRPLASAFRYDESRRSIRLSRPLARGDIVPAYPEFALAAVRSGDRLTLISVAGPVLIERQVEALQPARAGERLFVRSPDGQVFSARYEAGGP